MNHQTQIPTQRGFTLIEMLVVLAIMGVVLAVTVGGQRAFNRSIVLSNTAYDIALSIRQAQTYGVSGRVAQGTPSATYGYGVDIQSFPANKYVLFADTGGTGCNATVSSIANAPDTKTGDCMYTSGTVPGADVKVQSVQINNNVSISGVCVYKGALYIYCSSGTNPLLQVDISFVRPEPGAIIIAQNALGTYKNLNVNMRFDKVCLKLSAGGSNRYIVVNQVGIISVISAAAAVNSCPNL